MGVLTLFGGRPFAVRGNSYAPDCDTLRRALPRPKCRNQSDLCDAHCRHESKTWNAAERSRHELRCRGAISREIKMRKMLVKFATAGMLSLCSVASALAGSVTQPGETVGLAAGAPLPQGLYFV